MNVARTVVRVAIPIGIIAAGAAVAVVLVKTGPETPRADREDRSTLVEVQSVESSTHRIAVHAQGTVVPAQRVVLIPQVGGRVIWQSDELVPGGRIEAGTPLVRIDPRDYRVAVEQSAAELNRARLAAELERGRQVVAQREWQLFDDADQTTTDEGRALALRQPQVENARVAVNAAQSGVQRATLNLRRTTLSTPFNAVVQNENVDVGQVVGPASQLAVLVGTDAFWVQVSVPVETLSRIDVPGVNADVGSRARIWQEVGGEQSERQGFVVRLYGDLDPVGRMARVLVEIPDPFQQNAEAGGDRLPLLLGAYVHVEIDGHEADELIEVPRIALREGQRVWVMNGAGELEIRDVGIAWRREDSVLVSTGLTSGEQIVTSRIPTPVAGMALRTEQVAEPEEARADAAEASR